jgi:hypothetical protein
MTRVIFEMCVGRTGEPNQTKEDQRRMLSVRGLFSIARSSNDITVLSGRGLAAKDVGGKSDPYCIVLVDQEKFQTKVATATLDPIWVV